jgi:hypothetical protein
VIFSHFSRILGFSMQFFEIEGNGKNSKIHFNFVFSEVSKRAVKINAITAEVMPRKAKRLSKNRWLSHSKSI